jgi:hypothetical protein
VPAEDYKYFITPDAPAKPRASIPQSKAGHKSRRRPRGLQAVAQLWLSQAMTQRRLAKGVKRKTLSDQGL